jgi:hypothetical protein
VKDIKLFVIYARVMVKGKTTFLEFRKNKFGKKTMKKV